MVTKFQSSVPGDGPQAVRTVNKNNAAGASLVYMPKICIFGSFWIILLDGISSQHLIMPKINIILANVESEKLTLPAFQRGYVWNRQQVKALFDSLYREHPVGSLLTWQTQRNGTHIELLLDGQQRVTSLYGVIKGKPPAFFVGNPKAFTALYFHATEERFEFYQSIKMKGDPFWFDVTEVMKAGAGGLREIIRNQFKDSDELLDDDAKWRIMGSLSTLVGLENKEFHIEQVTGDNRDVDEVVDIFNRLNSAGTRLSTGDLALAKISAKWPEVRDQMYNKVKIWAGQGFGFELDWLLRCVNAVVHGEAAFRYLHTTPKEIFKNGLERTVVHVDTTLTQISDRLGLDHKRVLFAKYAIPVIVRHLELHEAKFPDQKDWNLLLYWYLRAGMHGRFSGSTETKIKRTLEKIDGTPKGIERLLAEIGTTWGRPQIIPADFDSWSIGAYSYPILYWMTRMGGARDFCTGIQLKTGLLGKGAKLQVHHIFPKAVLYEAGYPRPQVNAVGNFCFLTANSNQWISAAAPAEPSRFVKGSHDDDLRRMGTEGYFPWVQEHHTDALESQWIPMDAELWKVENYPDFLEARRQLLADAANRYLTELNPEHSQNKDTAYRQRSGIAPSRPDSHISSVDEEEELKNLQTWMASHGLPAGEFGYDLAGESETGNRVIIDLAWPNGIQEGQGRPVALLLDEPAETYQIVNQTGYDCYIDVGTFKQYVRDTIIGE